MEYNVLLFRNSLQYYNYYLQINNCSLKYDRFYV
jgi:hypothetical protein